VKLRTLSSKEAGDLFFAFTENLNLEHMEKLFLLDLSYKSLKSLREDPQMKVKIQKLSKTLSSELAIRLEPQNVIALV